MKGLAFSEPMVKAWLEGRKTVTRRLMKPQPIYSGFTKDFEWDRGGQIGVVSIHEAADFARYLPGETVYIKESCYICGSDSDGAPLAEPPVVYRADGARKSDRYPYFRSPRFMPAWASRSHALIVSVRPERVQEITEEEAFHEGMNYRGADGELHHLGDHPSYSLLEFQHTWETLHPGTWDKNPWAWRIELEKVTINERK